MNNIETVAKLLATEDIDVVHANVSTASFDVKNRVLTLPMWKDMESFTYDHLVGHEVGHAKYTPTEEWMDVVKDSAPGFKTFINIVEDARIERMIQVRYPGLRRSFVKSYRKMLSEGMFGADLETINKYKLIDRLNVYFKCGGSSGVRIEREEEVWVKKIEDCLTFADVLRVSEELYESAKSEKPPIEQSEEGQEMDFDSGEDDMDDMDDMDSESGEDDSEDGDSESGEDSDSNYSEDGEDGDSESGEDDDSESGEDSDSNYSEDGEDDMDSDEEEESGSESGEDETADPTSETDKALSESIAEQYSGTNYNANFIKLPEVHNVEELVIGYKEIINDIYGDGYYTTPKRIEYYGFDDLKASSAYKKFLLENKKSIDYLVKEFEMKKAATNHARTVLSDSGELDMVKMNNYKFTDDIFRKVGVVMDGKNHGLIMYLDWSGSMYSNLFGTVTQLLNLVHFCRNVSIPFRVLAFSSGTPNELYKDEIDGFSVKKLRFLEFFSSKMSRKDFIASSKILLEVAKNYQFAGRGKYRLYDTPLNESIVAAVSIHNTFKKENRLDIVNTIFLTDGSASTSLTVEDGKHRVFKQAAWHSDIVTKKRFKTSTYLDLTKKLLNRYKERTGSTVVGFFITPSNKSSFINIFNREMGCYQQTWETWKSIKKNKMISIASEGYDKRFLIMGGSDLETSNGQFEVSDTATKNQIKKAFGSVNKERKASRAILSEFIDEISS